MASQFDPGTISFSSAVAQERDFLLTKPDGAAWADFFAGSAGTTIVEFLAGLKTFLAYHAITGRAESYLQHAQKLTSARAEAEFLGHSAYRGRRTHYRLSLVPGFTGTVSRFDLLGTVRGLDVVAMETKAVNLNVPVELEVVFGNLLTESVNTPSGNRFVFRFTSPDVSEDFRVFLNSVELLLSTAISDLENDKSITLTNAYGAVDLFDLNKDTNLFDTGDTFQLQYVGFGPDSTIQETSIVLTIGTVLDLQTMAGWVADASYGIGDVVVPSNPNGFYFRATTLGLSGGTEPTWPIADAETVTDFGVAWKAYAVLVQDTARLEAETADQLRINAPLTHETQKLIRARRDYLKTYRNLDTRIVDTNGADKNAAVVLLTAVRNDLTDFTTLEKQGFIASLMAFRPFGVRPPIIQDPVRIDLDVRVDLVLLPGIAAPGNTNVQVTSVIQKFQKVLQQDLDLGAMEYQVSRLLNDDKAFFVQTSRAIVTTDWAIRALFASSQIVNPVSPAFYFKSVPNVRTEWDAGHVYEEGDLIVPTSPNGFLYEADAITGDGMSGVSEPVWPVVIGDTVMDNAVTWRSIGPVIKPWEANHLTVLDEMTSPVSAAGFYFRAVDNIEDYWQASNTYVLGESVVPTNATANTNQYVFEATNIQGAGLSGLSEPVWPIGLGITVVDNDVTWTNRGTVIPRWQPSHGYAVGSAVVAATPTSPRRVFEIQSPGGPGTSGAAEPVWDTGLGGMTSDGSVLWTTIEEGLTGLAEPAWTGVENTYTQDAGRSWQALLIGRSGPIEPTWPTVSGRTIVDDAVLWRNQGANDTVLAINWDEFFVFAVTVNLT